MQIQCGEGKVVVAKPADGIDFGGVTSCMTITCILKDNRKVAGHDGVDKRVKPQIIYALKGQVTALKKSIVRVIAAGAGSCWTPHLQSQQELFDGMAKNDPRMKGMKGLEALGLLEPFLVSGNQDKFKDILSRDFGIASANVSYTNYDYGRIQITAGGQLQLGD